MEMVNQAEGEEKETALAGASKKDQILSDAVLPGASLKRKRVEKEPEDQWSCKRSPDILAK